MRDSIRTPPICEQAVGEKSPQFGGLFPHVLVEEFQERTGPTVFQGTALRGRYCPNDSKRSAAMTLQTSKDTFAEGAEKAAEAERAIQQEVDRKEKARGKSDRKSGAMQAGARKYPEPPFPHQHL